MGEVIDLHRHRCGRPSPRLARGRVFKRRRRSVTLHLVDGSLLAGSTEACACLLLAEIAAGIPDIALTDGDHLAVTGLDVLLLDEGFGDPLTGTLLVDRSSGIALTIQACATIYSRIVIVSSGPALESTATELTACGARTILVALSASSDAGLGGPLTVIHGGATLS